MDFKEVDQALEELEGRIERLKALYEQYFMGIEKLEPLVPRKDVDRRIQILRREQVRNTAQRFKFNTLVQRYNSFQQYWARVAREIENGTYHRDVARAAARFGAKETLTIFGKKQAEKYQRLVANQEARKAKRKTTHVIDEEMLADDELLFVDDEAEAAAQAIDDDDESRPTPVIPGDKRASAPPVLAIPPLPPPPRASTPGMLAAAPPLPPGVVRASGQMPAPVVNVKDDIPEEFDLQDDEILEVVQDKPGRTRKIRPETMFPIMMRRPTEQVPKVQDPPSPEPAQRSPSIPPDPEAGKKRVAALAAQVKQRTSTAPSAQANRPLDLELDLGGQGTPPPEAPASKRSRALDLDFDGDPKSQSKPLIKTEKPLDLDLDLGPKPRETAAAKIERPAPVVAPVGVNAASEPEGLARRTAAVEAPAAAEKMPEVRDAPVDSSRAVAAARADESRARMAAAGRERAQQAREAREASSAAEEQRERAQQAREARQASSAADGLSENRIRQIYGEYVDAKRRVKESTAGVTYDALAKQLRQQAEKLEASHPGRKVDYSVVMKNGKPTLKPVLR